MNVLWVLFYVPPNCCKPFPSSQEARPWAPAQGCPSPATWELCRFPGLVPSLPSRGEKVRAGSRTEASPYTALGGQIQGGRATADRCAGCSQYQYKPQHQNFAQACSGPLGGFTCPTAGGPSYLLPCNYRASISHSGSKGRSRAKPRVPQSLASHISNCWCSWGKDRKHPARSPHSPFPVTRTTVGVGG